MRTQVWAAAALFVTVTACGAAPLQITLSQSEHAKPAASHQIKIIARHTARHSVVHLTAQTTRGLSRTEARLVPAESQPPPRVYLLRGLMNVFSLGMDDLAEQLRRTGIETTIANHADADRLISEIIAGYAAGDRAPIVLIGHSLGADAVMLMAASLDRSGVPVDLVIPFDATAPHEASANIARVVNFTKRFLITPGAGFHGALANIDLSGEPGIDHLNIDKSSRLHAQVLRDVRQLTAAPRAISRRPSPAPTFVSGG